MHQHFKSKNIKFILELKKFLTEEYLILINFTRQKFYTKFSSKYVRVLEKKHK